MASPRPCIPSSVWVLKHSHGKGNEANNDACVIDHYRFQEGHDTIRQKCPDLIVNLTSALGAGATPEQRIAQSVTGKPEIFREKGKMPLWFFLTNRTQRLRP